MSKTIVKVRALEGAEEWATFEDWVDDHTELIVGDASACSASEIGELLDRDAENGNYHEAVGAGELIARIATEVAGESLARQIMVKLAGEGGVVVRP